MYRIKSKVALVFPGVGSQHTNMAKSFYENSVVSRNTFEEASDILNMDMAKICFSNEYADKLNKIDISQLSLVTACMAIFNCFIDEIGLQPFYCLGYSLGEYSALCAAGIISFSDTLRIVKERGRIIRETLESCKGTMIWVININHKIVEEVCRKYTERGEVYISAYDSPSQCSISGAIDAIHNVTQLLEKNGAIVYPLKMSGPFHSPFMAKAADEMKSVLLQYDYHFPACKVISNYNAESYYDTESLIENLSKQIISPVRWQESVTRLLDQNIINVIEIGPKDVLKFLLKKISSQLIPYSFNDYNLCNELRNKLFIHQDEYRTVIEKSLKVAISTRNYNSNYNDYTKGAIQPYKEIEEIYKNLLCGKIPTEKDVSKAMNMALSVMETKKTPTPLIEKNIQFIMDGKVIS